MKKRNLIIAISASFLLIAGAATGVTLAAVYHPSSESYSFDASSNQVETFAVGHYFASGTGTNSDPYLISSPMHLRNLSKLNQYGFIPTDSGNSVKNHFKLANSFTWSGDALTPIGDTTKPWKGVFEGDGKTIHGLTISAGSATYSGMFGYVDGGTVQNFILSAPELTTTGTSTVGFAVGKVNSGTCTKIGIYGGTSSLKCRAKLVLGGASTNPNCIVGAGTATCLNFLTSVSGANLSAATSATYSSATSAATYYLWNNNGTVTNSN